MIKYLVFFFPIIVYANISSFIDLVQPQLIGTYHVNIPNSESFKYFEGSDKPRDIMFDVYTESGPKRRCLRIKATEVKFYLTKGNSHCLGDLIVEMNLGSRWKWGVFFKQFYGSGVKAIRFSVNKNEFDILLPNLPRLKKEFSKLSRPGHNHPFDVRFVNP